MAGGVATITPPLSLVLGTIDCHMRGQSSPERRKRVEMVSAT